MMKARGASWGSLDPCDPHLALRDSLFVSSPSPLSKNANVLLILKTCQCFTDFSAMLPHCRYCYAVCLVWDPGDMLPKTADLELYLL